MNYKLFFFLFIAGSILIYGNGNSKEKEGTYLKLYNQIRNMKPDEQKTAAVSGLTLKRDAGNFILEEGTLILCEPVNERICAAIFIGTGSFIYTPPTKIEKDQLFRFYEKDNLNEKFDYLFLMFADSTLSELESSLNFQPGKASYRVHSQARNSINYLSDDDKKYFNSDFMMTFLENEYNDLFYAHFDTYKNGTMFFQIDPFSEEEVSLQRKYSSFRNNYRETINKFPKAEKLKKRYDSYEVKDRYYVNEYIIDAAIESNLDFLASAEIKFTPLEDSLNWINFRMYYDLEVDSVFLGSNTKAEFFKGEENHILWVYSEKPFIRDNQYSIKVFYQGDILNKNQHSWIHLKTSNYWFPRYVNIKKANFNLTFHYPSKYKFACVGDKILEKTSGDITTSQWITSEPIIPVSFNIGLFNEYKLEQEGIPAITVYISEGGHHEIAGSLASIGILSKGNMKEKIAVDIANCWNLFTNLFGELPLKEIYATPIPTYRGEAFSGLVHLSWATYQGIDDEADGLQFRAHEIAHQWWGIAVDFKTYHDQWISEGFSEYAGLWFVQAVLQDNEKFFEMLDDRRKLILGNRKYLFGSGQEAGPVFLGRRTNSSETKGDYDLIVYKKGAWVLHMLRNMLLDLNTMNEDRFKSLMQEFFVSYRGKSASTEDFKIICDKYFNEDMRWFFDQWIYDTKIPKYKFSYNSIKTVDGNYKVTCRVKQENVPSDFKSSTILFIKLKDDRIARVRVRITGDVSEFELPLLPEEPDKIIFNDLNSVLCEVEYEKWK